MYYKVTLVVEWPGVLDIDLDLPPSQAATQPVLPNSHLPKQNLVGGGRVKIKSTSSVILYIPKISEISIFF